MIDAKVLYSALSSIVISEWNAPIVLCVSYNSSTVWACSVDKEPWRVGRRDAVRNENTHDKEGEKSLTVLKVV